MIKLTEKLAKGELRTHLIGRKATELNEQLFRNTYQYSFERMKNVLTDKDDTSLLLNEWHEWMVDECHKLRDFHQHELYGTEKEAKLHQKGASADEIAYFATFHAGLKQEIDKLMPHLPKFEKLFKNPPKEIDFKRATKLNTIIEMILLGSARLDEVLAR